MYCSNQEGLCEDDKCVCPNDNRFNPRSRQIENVNIETLDRGFGDRIIDRIINQPTKKLIN